MRNRLVVISLGVALGLVILGILHVVAQPAGGGPPMAGFGDMMMMPGWPPAPTAVVVASGDMVYIACDGQLTAFEGKTLSPVGTVTYWTRPELPQ